MSFQTEFVNLQLRWEVPEFAKFIICGANLSELVEKDNGVCPVAVGSTF